METVTVPGFYLLFMIGFIWVHLLVFSLSDFPGYFIILSAIYYCFSLAFSLSLS